MPCRKRDMHQSKTPADSSTFQFLVNHISKYSKQTRSGLVLYCLNVRISSPRIEPLWEPDSCQFERKEVRV